MGKQNVEGAVRVCFEGLPPEPFDGLTAPAARAGQGPEPAERPDRGRERDGCGPRGDVPPASRGAPGPTGQGFLVRTGETILEVRNVVVASGLFQVAKIPPFSAAYPQRSHSCPRANTANRSHCRRAPSWWSAARSRAARLQKSCTSTDARCICALAAPGVSRAAIAARMFSNGCS